GRVGEAGERLTTASRALGAACRPGHRSRAGTQERQAVEGENVGVNGRWSGKRQVESCGARAAKNNTLWPGEGQTGGGVG
ncbi:hypothetical protein B1218_31430, partial [Pseudomonas ogarae]